MSNFKGFISTIIGRTGLNVSGGAMEIAFADYLTQIREELLSFQEKTGIIYEKWQSSGGAFLAETDFFIKHGIVLFSLWLTEVFPFNGDDLKIKVAALGAVDSEYQIKYTFQLDEFVFLKSALNKKNLLNDDNLKKAAILILINAIKSISNIFSTTIDLDYKIFTTRTDVIVNDFSITIDYEAAGRIKK